MSDAKKIFSSVSEGLRRITDWWFTSIGFRVSFLMSAGLILVAVLIGAFFFWQGKKALDAEIRGRALYVAKDVSASSVDDIITANKLEIYKKLTFLFTANEDSPSGSDLLYIMAYNHMGELLIGRSVNDVFSSADSFFYTLPSGSLNLLSDIAVARESFSVKTPVFRIQKPDIYDLTFRVIAGTDLVGFVRVGISGERYSERFAGIMRKGVIALLVILLIGMAFSQIIALGITRPILRLSEAAENLSRQNWDSPLPVKGRDEISKLSQAFNQMALTLNQREHSLSRGNKDLFILHTAGLDLMENLDLDSLLIKIGARAQDLVRADTTSVAIIDQNERTLKYIGVNGSKAAALTSMDMPLEAGGIYNWMASYGTPLLISEAQTDFRLDKRMMEALGINCMMTVPLWSSNTMKGLLTAINKKGGVCFDKHDLRLFTVFSNLAAAALQNASLYSDLNGKMNELGTAQEQLVHSTKMAAIGELAANVAHEVNNPLTSVLGYTTHLMKTLDIPESAKRILGMMEQETLRVRKIIRNLLDFSRQKAAWMRPSDVLLPLKETVAFVQGAAEASSVIINEQYETSPAIVTIDTNAMKQVFINIINNALHAMPHGGTLTIRVTTEDESQAVIAFEDTGVGILPENINKVFEPFFSTKESGDGTGLGLSISYRIIKNHGGRIVVQNNRKTGAVFKIFLPLVTNPALISKQ